MKKILIVIAFCLTLMGAAFARARYLMVTGAGVGTDPDQSTADQAADSMAQTNLQNSCSGGTLNSSSKIFDQCSQLAGNYICNVNYTGVCQIGN